jgi:hypothetical protein
MAVGRPPAFVDTHSEASSNLEVKFWKQDIYGRGRREDRHSLRACEQSSRIQRVAASVSLHEADFFIIRATEVE